MSLEVAAAGALGFLSMFGPHIVALVLVGVFIAYKLRLMKKFGFSNSSIPNRAYEYRA